MSEPTFDYGYLKNRRIEMGLTQAVLAKRVGCHFTSISMMENGRTRPSVRLLSKIAAELNAPIGSFIHLNDES